MLGEGIEQATTYPVDAAQLGGVLLPPKAEDFAHRGNCPEGRCAVLLI